MRKRNSLTLAVCLGVAAAMLNLLTFTNSFDATLKAQDVEETPEPMSEDALIEQGETLYNDFCAACHQPEGQGVPGGAGVAVAPLDGNEFITSEPERMLMAILGGHGPMPSFQGALSNEEIAAIASYIRTAWSNDASVVQPETVAALTSEEDEFDGSSPRAETGADDVVPGAITVNLTGAEEVPGPGDEDAEGTAVVYLRSDSDEVCVDISVQNITLPATAAHIHQAPAGQSGDPVVSLTAPGEDGLSSTCAMVEATLMQDMLNNPENFYVNVHNADFPDGAARGQLG